MMRLSWLWLVVFGGAVVVACGSDDEGSEFGTGGGGGAAGSTGGSGGTVQTGGTGGSGGGVGGTSGSAGSAGSAGSDASGNCGDYGNDEICKGCLKQNCCAETAACAASATCDAMVVCARQCPDPTDTGSQCVQDCAGAAFDAGSNLQDYNALILCLGNNCGVDGPCTFL